MVCSRQGSSVHEISQARILEWVAFPSPRDLLGPVNEPLSPALKADSLLLSHQGSLWCIYIYMEYYLAIKKEEILLFVTIWMDFEGIMLNEISQTKINSI